MKDILRNYLFKAQTKLTTLDYLGLFSFYFHSKKFNKKSPARSHHRAGLFNHRGSIVAELQKLAGL